MTPTENKILGDLQERNAILQQCLEDISNSESIEQAKYDADQCLGALAVVDNITPRVPIWIGVQLGGRTPTKICIGLNQEDGNEVSWRREQDIDWINYDSKISVKYGIDAYVFDEDNKLIS